MKRILLSLLALVVLVIAIFAGLIASAFVGKSDIAPGVVDGFVHVVKDGFVTADILDVGDGKVALIDAGDDKKGTAILAELAAMKLDAHAVTAIFLTHGHRDHLAAAPLFADAKVYALAADIPLAEGRAGGHGLISQFMPIKPTGVHVTRGLADGEVVQVGNRAVHVFSIPGHTPGSAAYWVDGDLFLGDSAGATTDGKVQPAPKVFTDDPAQNRQTLKDLVGKLLAQHLDVKTLIFAHTGRLDGLQPLMTLNAEK